MDFIRKSGLRATLRSARNAMLTRFHRRFLTPLNAIRNAKKSLRMLEIGPGPERIANFETVNVVWGRNVDYIFDATDSISLPSNSFDVIYASHVLEHVAWYRSQAVINDWVRLLKPGGNIEIWVPDGLKIASAFVDAEMRGSSDYVQDGWWRFNESKDPCAWAAGRIFSYGDGTGTQAHFNWHISLFSERRLKALLESAGLKDVRRMTTAEVRGFDHGWINLGLIGTKPN